MKRFILAFMLVPLWQALLAQCAAPTITANGPTSFCTGGNVTLNGPTGNTWTQKADFGGGGRNYAISFSIGSKGYIGTGSQGVKKKDFWEYDPATGAWTQKADFGGTATNWATGFSIGNKGYIGTGIDINSQSTKDFWEYNPVTNAWTQKAAFGGVARYAATGFSIGGKGYIGVGLDNTGTLFKDFWEYDPEANSWKQKADFGGTARYDATGFSIGNNGYIGTGTNGTNKKDFWEYNPATNAWTQKADFGGTARNGGRSFSIGNKGYIGTGNDGSYKKDFWEYNPATNAWTQKADFGGLARYIATGFSIGSKGYIGTGFDINNNYRNDFWEYDPGYSYAWQPGGQTTASITVSTAGSYTITTTNTLGCSATSAATVVSVNTPAAPTVSVIQPSCSVATGTIVVSSPAGAGITYSINGSVYQPGTGFSNLSPGNYNVTVKSGNGCISAATPVVINIQPLTPATPIITASGATTLCPGGSVTLNVSTGNTWTQKADFGGGARYGSTGFSIGSKGYMGTGFDGANKKDFWEYDPATGAWTQKADFGGGVRSAATGFSIGNKGYIGTGFFDISSFKKDFWEYDPTNNAWTRKADFGGMERYGATGFNIGSKGYIGTGQEISGSYKKDFWEYDPAANAWTQKADFGGEERFGATGFSTTSKGYIGTGLNISSNLKKDFWEYDPINNAWIQKADFGGTGRYTAAGFSIGNKGYIGTGLDISSSYKKDFWEYDATSNAWMQKADFGGTGRYAATVFSIGSKGYVGTGYDGSYKKDFWEYDPGYSYAWQPGGQTTASITVSTAGSYTVTTTNALGCSATSAATVVSVNSIAPATVSVIQPTCTVATGTITVNTPTDAGLTYSIDGTNYQASNVFSNLIPGSYNATVKNNSGCVSSPTPVTIHPAPATADKPLITANGPLAFCSGGSVTLSAPAATTYQWSNGDITQTTIVNQSGSFTLKVTNAAGCTSPPSDPTIVTVNALPAKPVINAGGPTNFCAGSSVMLSAPLSTSYQWSNSAATQFVTVTQSGSYSVVVTNSNGCSSPASDATVVTVNPLPAKPVITASGSTSLCAGGSVTLTAPPSATYLWSTGAITQSILVTQAGSYSVTVKNAQGCSAASDATAVTVNAAISVSIPDRQVAVSGTEINTVYLGYTPASSIVLTATAGGGSGSLTYQWSTGATTPSITVSPNSATTYSVIVKDGSNCTGTATKTIHVIDVRCGNRMDKVVVCHNNGNSLCIGQEAVADHLSHGDQLGACGSATLVSRTTASTAGFVDNTEEEVAPQPAMLVYPNPGKGVFNVQLTGCRRSKVSIEITDFQGRIVAVKAAVPNVKTGLLTVPFNLSSQASGMYWIRMVDATGVLTTKVIVQR